jgi:hypothetical protein
MDYELFKNNTQDQNHFKIIDVDGDNKCFYSAIVNNMLHRSDTTNNPFSLINKRTFRVCKNSNTYESADIEYLEKARISLEVKTLAWLDKHRDDIFPDLGIKIRELVEMTHEIPFDLYIRRDIDDYPIWGGLPEQVAISNLYNVPIHIYRPVRFNKNNSKIYEGIIKNNNPNKDVRFQHTQTITPFKQKQNGSLPFYLLWKRYTDGDDHYMTLLENI